MVVDKWVLLYVVLIIVRWFIISNKNSYLKKYIIIILGGVIKLIGFITVHISCHSEIIDLLQ